MVLGFEEGHSLKAWLKSLGRAARQRELDAIVSPLLDALEVIHASDFLHRDIAPDNIIIRKDGSPVLIDFGSARGDIAKHSRTMSALVKPGYSPYEQYAENGVRQGPWTDIYALAATLYHAVCGKRPPDAPSRVVRDELVPAREAAVSAYRAGFLTAIDRALALDTTRRPQSIAAWRGDLLAPDPAKPGWLRRSHHAHADAGRGRGSRADAKTVALPGQQPPLPDVPGGKGGMAAYIDGLKSKTPSDPAIVMGGAVPSRSRRVQTPRRAPRTTVPRKPTAQSAPPTETELPPPPAVLRRKPGRRRAQRPITGTSWRPLLFKLLIGVGIAGAAVAYQEQLPRLEVKGSNIVTSAVRTVPQPAQLQAHRGGTAALAFTADGNALVTTGADGKLKMWSTAPAGSSARST